MGFQYRRRTKGKGAWLNTSYSEKNGLNFSGSFKAGPFTFNTGNSRRASRLTTRLGKGMRYISYGDSKRRSQSNDLAEIIIAVLIVIPLYFVAAIFYSLYEFVVLLIK